MPTLNTLQIVDDSIIGNDLRDFFIDMKVQADSLLSEFSFKKEVATSTICFSTAESCSNSLASYVCGMNQAPFLSLWFAHGNDCELHVAGDIVVACDKESYLFTNGFIYTFSCYNAGSLADKMLNNGLITFIGYTCAAHCPLQCQDKVAEAALSGLSSFLGGETAEECLGNLRKSYQRLLHDSTIDVISRGYLANNYFGLALKGKRELTVSELCV